MAAHASIFAGESHGQRSLAGYSPWGCKESDMTERLNTYTHITIKAFQVLQLSLLQLFNLKLAYFCFALSLNRVRLFAILFSPWNSPGQNTGMGSCSLLQGVFPTQGLNPGLLHYRQVLYQLSHQGSPVSFYSFICCPVCSLCLSSLFYLTTCFYFYLPSLYITKVSIYC